MSRSYQNLDHIVVATPDLAGTVAAFEAATGVAPELGGVHPDFGTRNHLVTFGGGAYLEIIGLDPGAEVTDARRVFNLHRVTEPKVSTFAIHPADPQAAIDAARALDVDLGELSDGRRRDTAGTMLTWRLTSPLSAEETGVIPFLIDWGETPSPADTVGAAAELVDFAVLHPDPAWVEARYAALGTEVDVRPADQPSLTLTVAGPSGTWTIG
ncbi:MAG: VOC family protein [Propionibacterium sp.]|nr:VOC family protein [Propionibacterium sp.]